MELFQNDRMNRKTTKTCILSCQFYKTQSVKFFICLNCRSNNGMIPVTYDMIMKQLRRNHSEIRLSSFQLMKELFERSHSFRLLVLEDLQLIFDKTLETNEVPLPPPKSAAKSLRTLSAETMHQWVNKYGSTYRKLEHGYNYLKQVKRASFNDIEGRSETERLREEERKLKLDKVWKGEDAK